MRRSFLFRLDDPRHRQAAGRPEDGAPCVDLGLELIRRHKDQYPLPRLARGSRRRRTPLATVTQND